MLRYFFSCEIKLEEKTVLPFGQDSRLSGVKENDMWFDQTPDRPVAHGDSPGTIVIFMLKLMATALAATGADLAVNTARHSVATLGYRRAPPWNNTCLPRLQHHGSHA